MAGKGTNTNGWTILTRFSEIRVFILLSLLLSGVLVLTLLSDQATFRKSDNMQTPIQEEYAVDDVNDGVYDSYKYKFRFRYPVDKFKQVYSDNESGGWIYQIIDNSGYGTNYIKLNATISQNDHDRLFYDDIYSLKSMESIKAANSTFINLSSKDFDLYKRLVYFSRTDSESEIEHSVGYSAVFLKHEGGIVRINYFTQPEYESFLEQSEDTFNQIVESFEFY